MPLVLVGLFGVYIAERLDINDSNDLANNEKYEQKSFEILMKKLR